MNIFVTGGNGFIGSAVVRKLAAQGHHVRCLLRDTSDTARISGVAFERVPGDVRDAASVSAGAAGCDGILHLASLSNWNDIHSPQMHDVVIGGSRNVLDAARAHGNVRTVFVSSIIAVNGTEDPVVQDEDSECTLPLHKLVYAQSKREVESMCRAAAGKGLPVTIVNPAEVYGPDDTALITAGNLIDFAKSSPVLVPSGGTSVVYVDDVADGIIAALERGRPGERYILGGDNLSIKQLAELTLELLGQKKKIMLLPNGLIRGVARVGSALRIPLPFNPAVIPYATLYWFMDNGKARRDLGVSFRSAREALAPTIEWLKSSGRV